MSTTAPPPMPAPAPTSAPATAPAPSAAPQVPRNPFMKPQNKKDFFIRVIKAGVPKLSGLDKNAFTSLFSVLRTTSKFDKDYEDYATTTTDDKTRDEAVRKFIAEKFTAGGYPDKIRRAIDDMRPNYRESHPGQDLPILDETKDFQSAPQPGSQASSFDKVVNERAGLAVDRVQPGQQIPGLGVVGAGGQLSRGITENVGGGKLATIVSSNEAGDYVSQGPQSVEVAKQTLRPKFVVAGGEDVRPSIQEDGQSNAIFESFSIVPDGYGLGPENRLHLLNKQNDVMRFGAEKLYEPRVDAPITPARPIPAQWKESMSLQELEEAYATKIGMELLKARGVSLVERNPIGVLEDDMNVIPSSKGLPRQQRGPSPFMTTVFNLEDFLPARDPPGMQMNSLLGSDTLRGTLGYRRKRVFDSLMK